MRGSGGVAGAAEFPPRGIPVRRVLETGRQVRTSLADVLAAATRTAEWKSDLARHFWTEMYLDGEALRDYLSRERTEMRTVLSELGLLSG